MLMFCCHIGSWIKDQLQWDTRFVCFVVAYFQLVREKGWVGDEEEAAVLAGAHFFFFLKKVTM